MIEEKWVGVEEHLRQYGFECFDVCQYEGGLARKYDGALAGRAEEWNETLAAVRELVLAVLDETVRATEDSVAAVFALRARLAAMGREAGKEE